MSLVIMAIGIPGSGKTTLLKPLATKYNLTYINRDDIYEELFGVTSNEQSRIAEVRDEASRRTQSAIENGEIVVRDSTFVEVEDRKAAISSARAAGAKRIVGLYLEVDSDVAKARNRERERVVKEDVIDWMQVLLRTNPPSLDDGFDALYSLDQIEELEKSELQLFKT
ncbi:hypothetical protein BH11PAT2_BH11PAT2_08390 [soil metagenome]